MTDLLPPPESVARARRFTTCSPGKCLYYVSNWLTDGAMLGIYAPDANHAWEHAERKHTDATPPAGVPIYIGGSQYGHIALSTGGGRCRSTDWPSRGVIGEVGILDLARSWGRTYRGWSEDFYGNPIPTIGDEDMPSAEDIALAVWRYDQGGKAQQAWSYVRDGAKKVWQYDKDGTQPQTYRYLLDAATEDTLDELAAHLDRVEAKLDRLLDDDAPAGRRRRRLWRPTSSPASSSPPAD